MCGIGFISPAPESGLPMRQIARLMLHELADRGKHAAGVAWKRPDGATLYRKQAGHPVRLAATLAAVKGSRSLDRAPAVLLHTRHATQGSPDREENNHPIVRPGVVMVHNGHVRNAAELYGIAGAEPLAAVDSDALAALIETASTQRELRHRFVDVDGLAAIAWMDVNDDPDDAATLYCARIDTRPLVIAETSRGDLIGGSTIQAIAGACSMVGVQVGGYETVPEGRMYRVRAGTLTDRWHLHTGSGGVDDVREYARGGRYVATA